MKFELRLKDKKDRVTITDSENIENAKKYFMARKNMNVEAFDNLFEVVEKKLKKNKKKLGCLEKASYIYIRFKNRLYGYRVNHK